MKLDINASYLHIRTKDGEMYDFPINNIEYLKMDNESSQIVNESKELFIDNISNSPVEGVVVIRVC